MHPQAHKIKTVASALKKKHPILSEMQSAELAAVAIEAMGYEELAAKYRAAQSLLSELEKTDAN